jgi:hypothetical protein
MRGAIEGGAFSGRLIGGGRLGWERAIPRNEDHAFRDALDLFTPFDDLL